MPKAKLWVDGVAVIRDALPEDYKTPTPPEEVAAEIEAEIVRELDTPLGAIVADMYAAQNPGNPDIRDALRSNLEALRGV